MVALFKCGICDKLLKTRRGLGGHVTGAHHLGWGDYQQKYGLEEVPDPEPQEEVPDMDRRISDLEKTVGLILSGPPSPGTAPTVIDVPMEEVEVKANQLNYKGSLDPLIFSLYSKFKGVAVKQGHPWDGDFADFLLRSVKDAPKVHGIYDTTLQVSGNKFLVELPAELIQSG